MCSFFIFYRRAHERCRNNTIRDSLEKLQDNRFREVEEEPLDPIKLCEEDHHSDGEQIMVLDLAQLEKETCQATSKDINKNITILQVSIEKLCEHIVPQVFIGVEMCYGSKERNLQNKLNCLRKGIILIQSRWMSWKYHHEILNVRLWKERIHCREREMKFGRGEMEVQRGRESNGVVGIMWILAVFCRFLLIYIF